MKKESKELVIKSEETTDIVVKSKEELRIEMKASLKEIDKKLKKLNYYNNGQYKSTGSFKLNENDSNNVNIHNSVDISYLIKALSFMIRINKEYKETADSLGLKTYPVCIWLGISIDCWIHDLKMRLSMVVNASLIKDLTEGKARLETFLSEEDRLSKKLEDIKKIL